MIAFDSDVLIYTASEANHLGARVAAFLADPRGEPRIGSVLLLPEVLSKPLRVAPGSEETATLTAALRLIELQPFDEATARLAMMLGAKYKLRAADATHLATAIACGADRFLTNNRRDLPPSITEIDIIYPDQLPEPA